MGTSTEETKKKKKKKKKKRNKKNNKKNNKNKTKQKNTQHFIYYFWPFLHGVTLLMSTYNICFRGEIRKYSPDTHSDQDLLLLYKYRFFFFFFSFSSNCSKAIIRFDRLSMRKGFGDISRISIRPKAYHLHGPIPYFYLQFPVSVGICLDSLYTQADPVIHCPFMLQGPIFPRSGPDTKFYIYMA